MSFVLKDIEEYVRTFSNANNIQYLNQLKSHILDYLNTTDYTNPMFTMILKHSIITFYQLGIEKYCMKHHPDFSSYFENLNVDIRTYICATSFEIPDISVLFDESNNPTDEFQKLINIDFRALDITSLQHISINFDIDRINLTLFSFFEPQKYASERIEKCEIRTVIENTGIRDIMKIFKNMKWPKIVK